MLLVMIPSLPTVLRLRFIAQVVLRTLMVLTFVWAIWQRLESLTPWLKPTSSGAAPRAAVDWWYVATSGLAQLVPYAGLVLILFLIERLILRWMIPADNPRCPRCGFSIDMSTPKCPECGLVLRLPARQEA